MTRFFSFRRTALAVVAAGILCFAGAAQAQTVPHRESVDGQTILVVPPTEDHPFIAMTSAGEGRGTQLGRYTEVFAHDITIPDAKGKGQILHGKFTSTAADGSTITGSYLGTYAILAGNIVRFDVTPIWKEGTGRLAGITGQGTAVAFLNLATGEFHVDTDAEWNLR
jgi:hypothetical protein